MTRLRSMILPRQVFSWRVLGFSKGLYFLTILVMVVGALGFMPPQPVTAAVLVVNTTDDDRLSDCTKDNGCSLRGAIEYANNHSGADVITLPAGLYNLAGPAGEDNNMSGDLDVREYGGNLEIVGEDPDNTTISGFGIDRIFHVSDFGSGITLTLRNMTLRDGNPGPLAYGGAIKSYGSLVLENVVVEKNTAHLGGGIYIYNPYLSKLVINNSTINNNQAFVDGGGVYVWSQRGEITNSNIDSNKAFRRGGGVFNNSPSLKISTSTFYSNYAIDDGGGLMNFAFLGDQITTQCNRCTFSANNPNAVENLSNAVYGPTTKATIVFQNSILDNSYGHTCKDTPFGPLCSNYEGSNCENTVKKNGIAEIKDAGSNVDSGKSCGIGSGKGSLGGTNPMLETIEDNGGMTATLGLKPGSPAIDRGDMQTCDYRDQRGLSNVGKCDSGAFEYDAKPVLYAYGGLSNERIGSVEGSPLRVLVTNAFGNPLFGWRVFYSPDAGANVTLSSDMVKTDTSGRAMTVAALNEDPVVPYYVTAMAGLASVKFRLSSMQTVGVPYNGGSSAQGGGLQPVAAGGANSKQLPVTGFAPNVKTLLPQQPNEKAYHDASELTLEIPRLGVKMPIMGIPHTESGWDLSWLGSEAGYLEGTAFPTWAGNSVLTGHAVLADGLAGPFAQLGQLGWGDVVVVHAFGQRYRYEVREVKTVPADDLSVLGHEDLPWLTLITCQGYDASQQTYQSRLVVRAVQVAIE